MTHLNNFISLIYTITLRFGHVTDLEKFHQKRTILIRHELPSNITQMINDHGNLEEFQLLKNGIAVKNAPFC